MRFAERGEIDRWLAQLLASTTETAVIFVDLDAVIVGWHGASERIFGYTSAQALGQPFEALFTPEDRRLGLHRQEMVAALTSGRSEDDRWHLRRDGSRFWGSGLLEAVRDENGHPIVMCKVLRDRTDLRTQIDALQNRVAMQEARALRRSNLVVSLGHELRNALAPLKNVAFLLEHTASNDVRTRALEVVQRQLAAMTTLLDDLSESFSAGLQRPRIEMQPVVVQEAVRLAANAIQPAIDQRRQQFTITMPSAPFVIDADPNRLQQMLLNLLENASKYTPEHGRIAISATVETDTAVIRITDTGMGIRPEVLPAIFELFTRGGLEDSPPGLGVGLAVVKQLVTLHGGSVEARSPGPGKGSVFALRIPLRKEAPPGGGARATPA